MGQRHVADPSLGQCLQLAEVLFDGVAALDGGDGRGLARLGRALGVGGGSG